MSENNYNEENENEENSNSEFEYDISIYASEKENFNQMQDIKKVKEPTKIKSIQITLSKLSNLNGINLFTNITHLDLSNNQITSLKNYFYNNIRIKYLDLSCNKIINLDGIEDLENLIDLNISHNKISSLETFSRFINKNSLQKLNLKGNLIYELKQFDYLVGFNNLKTLILSQDNDTNPVCSNANCNEYIEGILNKRIEIPENSNNINNNINYNNPNFNTNPLKYNTANNLFNIQQPFLNYPPQNNTNNINVSDINHKRFLNTTINRPFVNMNLYKEEMKNLHYNIQDIYRDQKKLIFKYETDANKWEIKFEELSNEIEQLTKENKILKKI